MDLSLLYRPICDVLQFVSFYIIGSFARNFHIGFHHDYEVIKVSNKTPDDRIV